MQIEYKKKYAFISYSHKDDRVAKWLQRKLETYRLPAGVYNECEDTRYLRPIFRDRTDLNSGVLNDEIIRNLETSKFLIVLCSSHSAHSKWVNDEIDIFISLGYAGNIIPVLINGSGIDQLPHRLLEYYRENPKQELLAVDLSLEGKESAFVRVVSRMLELEYDVLWDRYKRYERRRWTMASVSAAVAMIFAYWFAMPVSLNIELKEELHNLPHTCDARIYVGDAEYKIDDLCNTVEINSLPGCFRMRSIPVCFDATYYCRDTSMFRFGIGVDNEVVIDILRDDSFRNFSGTVYNQDGDVMEGAVVQIDSICVKTDINGFFHIELPLEKQAETQSVRVTKDGYAEFVREDECPGTNLGYILRY